MDDKKSLFPNAGYFWGYFLFFASGLIFLLVTSKSFSFLFLANHHNRWLDDFFTLFTNLGDGLFSIAIGLMLLALRRFNVAWQVLVAYSVSGLLAQFIKRLVESPRPVEFFKFREPIYFVAGVTNTGNTSFPSGHAASVFALATILAFFTKDKRITWLYLIGAALVGYSRMYLSQHFLVDVLAGSLLGVLSAVAVHRGFEKWRKKPKPKAGSDASLPHAN